MHTTLTCSHQECGSASCSTFILGCCSKNVSIALLKTDWPCRISHTRVLDERLAERNSRCTNRPTQAPENQTVAFMCRLNVLSARVLYSCIIQTCTLHICAQHYEMQNLRVYIAMHGQGSFRLHDACASNHIRVFEMTN